MESYIDVTSTAFQAILAVCTVFTAGYILNGKDGATLSPSLLSLSRKVLLPCLVFTTFASASWSWKLLLSLWPILVIAVVSHLASLAFALLVWRFGDVPKWVIQSLTYNNVSSYPLLLVFALYRLSPSSNVGGFSHLVYRGMDTPIIVLHRLVFYILINFVVVSLARSVISLLIAKIVPSKHIALEEGDVESEVIDDDPIPDEEATERTPLVRTTSNPASPSSLKSRVLGLLSPLVVATFFGLLIGLISPVQRFIIGNLEEQNGTFAWQSVGSGLVLLGAGFALVEIVALGAALRAGEKKASPEEVVPPVLGTVLLVTFWRYVVTPVIIISIVYGFGKIPGTHIFSKDPAFSFVLALSTISPPTIPHLPLNPFKSQVNFYLFYLSLLTSLSLSAAIAISGHGVSFDTKFDFVRALKSAGGGGIAGAAAMVVQVLSLMPMRTIMNYQYRYGGGIKHATKTLYNDGGIKRYYAGLGAALFQGPLSRFGDTAANAGIFALLESLTWPVLVKTVVASLCAASFRMTLTPIDTLKTTQQTQGGVAGLKLLRERVRTLGVGSLWYGALATAAATFVGNYPWFATYNYLSAVLPEPHTLIQKLARQAFIGFVASVVSDTVSNSLRVVKTYRQVHEGDVGYLEAAREIVASEGLLGLFGRGLPTRLLTNGLQGLLFSILWKLFEDIISGKDKGA